MSEIAVVAEHDLQLESHCRLHLAGVLVMSFASLLVELALTRLFSVVLFYHFAFLAISIALLGLGAGGVVAYLAKNRLAAMGHPRPGRAHRGAQCRAAADGAAG